MLLVLFFIGFSAVNANQAIPNASTESFKSPNERLAPVPVFINQENQSKDAAFIRSEATGHHKRSVKSSSVSTAGTFQTNPSGEVEFRGIESRVDYDSSRSPGKQYQESVTSYSSPVNPNTRNGGAYAGSRTSNPSGPCRTRGSCDSSASSGVPGGAYSSASSGVPGGAYSSASSGVSGGAYSSASSGVPDGAYSSASSGVPDGAYSSASSGGPAPRGTYSASRGGAVASDTYSSASRGGPDPSGPYSASRGGPVASGTYSSASRGGPDPSGALSSASSGGPAPKGTYSSAASKGTNSKRTGSASSSYSKSQKG